jgi:hypothetical protein
VPSNPTFSGSDFRRLADFQRLYDSDLVKAVNLFFGADSSRESPGSAVSCYVYCLYSTEDGRPRYVGKASDKVSYRFRKHVADALDMTPGPVNDWIRDVWRRSHDVAVYTIQERIIPKDLNMFEQYWIDQFADLVNVVGNKPGKSDSVVATQITKAIQQQLALADSVSNDQISRSGDVP